MPSIDLNCDCGESFGAYTMGDDAAMLDIVTSANVACGFHGGDPEVMAATFRMAKEKGVAVGAHPGFPDLWGFGRRRLPFSTDEIERLVAYQIGAAQALAAYAGHKITHVKPHGALSNVAMEERDVARAIARARRAPSIPSRLSRRRPQRARTGRRRRAAQCRLGDLCRSRLYGARASPAADAGGRGAA